MKLLSKLAKLSAARRCLLLESWARLLGASLAVRVLPASSMTRMWSGNAAERSAPAPGAPSRDDICWSVQKAAALIPGATCLSQAIVARRMLINAGYAAQVHVGVQLGGERPLHAHAWVISDGRIVAGANAVAGYMPLRRSAS